MNNKKKILLFSLLLILFMSISAISAVDNATDINQDDESLTVIDTGSAESDDVVASDEASADYGSENLNVSDSSISFSTLKNKIKSESSVTLTSNVVYESGDAAIGFAKDVTVNGNGYTINAKGKIRFFLVPTGSTLVLKNINFVNGYFSGSGGAILNSGTLKITNCTFTKCKAVGSNAQGGAIAGSGKGTIKNCNFINCTSGYMGGAVASNNLKFYYCNFTDNTARHGGAISGTAYLYNSIFTNCIATGGLEKNTDDWGGGAGNGAFPVVDSCSFINCKATGAYGGALRGTVNCNNCKFIKCVAKEGGAIRGKCTVAGCTFKNCKSTSKMGGAIFTEKSTISKSTFIGCVAAKSNAGAIFAGNNVKISNCKFDSCKASKGMGGAIYGNFVATKCTFNNNYAKCGGAVSSYSGTVKSSTFTKNSAKMGGAAYNIKALTSCKFNKNTATYGGAVYNAQKVVSSKFGDNFAKYGAVSYNKVNVVFKKVTVKNTKKLVQGLFYNNHHKLTLTNSKIINTGKFSKYLNYNTGTFIYKKNVLKSSYKVKKIAGPKKIKRS